MQQCINANETHPDTQHVLSYWVDKKQEKGKLAKLPDRARQSVAC